MELKVLHFTPYFEGANESLSRLDTLLTTMAGEAEVYLLTLSPVPPLPENGRKYTIHSIGNGDKNYGSKGIVNLLALHKRFLKLLYGFMPDIIHVHGSYSFINSRIELWSLRRGFPVVFSPDGGMTADFIEAEYGMRTWKLLTYQRDMVRRASAVVAHNKQEEEYILAEKLTDRVDTILPPPEGDPLGNEDYSDNIIAFYHKVLDSDKGLHLDKNCHEAVSALLHLSLAGSKERQPLCPEDILNLRSITPKQWRDIRIFAYGQGVLSNIDEATERMHLSVPEIDPSQVDFFAPRHSKDTSPLPDTLIHTSPITSHSIERKLQDAEEVIRKACVMILNIRHHIHRRSLTLRHLCELYSLFRFDNMDEDKFATTLKSLNLYTLACRLCQVLQEIAYLDEGFMPVPSLDDRGTAAIRQALMTY